MLDGPQTQSQSSDTLLTSLEVSNLTGSRTEFKRAVGYQDAGTTQPHAAGEFASSSPDSIY